MVRLSPAAFGYLRTNVQILRFIAKHITRITVHHFGDTAPTEGLVLSQCHFVLVNLFLQRHVFSLSLQTLLLGIDVCHFLVHRTLLGLNFLVEFSPGNNYLKVGNIAGLKQCDFSRVLCMSTKFG